MTRQRPSAERPAGVGASILQRWSTTSRSGTITDWREELRALVTSVQSQIQRGTDAFEDLLDRDSDLYHIVSYRGYGRPGRVLVLGRVLQDEGLSAPDPTHSKIRNLFAMLKRLESDPLPSARVRVRLPDGDREITADDEGYIRAWLDLVPTSPDGQGSRARRSAD